MEPEAQKGLLLMEIYLHVIAMENIMIEKGLMTEDELQIEMGRVRDGVLAYVKENPEIMSMTPSKATPPASVEPAKKPTPDRSKN